MTVRRFINGQMITPSRYLEIINEINRLRNKNMAWHEIILSADVDVEHSLTYLKVRDLSPGDFPALALDLENDSSVVRIFGGFTLAAIGGTSPVVDIDFLINDEFYAVDYQGFDLAGEDSDGISTQLCINTRITRMSFDILVTGVKAGKFVAEPVVRTQSVIGGDFIRFWNGYSQFYAIEEYGQLTGF